MKDKKKLVGVVVSDKMDKTIAVKIERLVDHPVVNRKVKRSKKIKAHDEKNEAKIGDKVEVRVTKPLSLTKRYYLSKIIKKGVQEAEL